MAMLKAQVARTPPPQWVRVVGGFTEHQFAEKRLPTLEEINAVAPDTPVFILHLYDRALLNGAALRAVGYTKDTPEPPGGEIVRDAQRRPDRPAARQAQRGDPLRDAGQGPEAAARVPDQLDAPLHARAEPAGRDRRHRRRRRLPELSGGLRRSSRSCADDGQLTRAHRLQPVHAEAEGGEGRLPAAGRRAREARQGDDYLPPQRRRRDAGLLAPPTSRTSASRGPDMPPEMEGELEAVVRILAAEPLAVAPARHLRRDDRPRARRVREGEPRHPVRRACTGSSTTPRPSPTATSSASRALGGGIAVQHRMAYQGEYFVERYGAKAAEAHAAGRAACSTRACRVGAGTDATRVASYNPWVSLSWLVTGRTVGGLRSIPQRNRLDRETALRHVDREGHLVLQRGRQEGADRGGPARRPGRARPRLLRRARETRSRTSPPC